MPEREVVIDELELLRLEPPELELRVRCGKGTYIRSLAADLGRELGCGAALAVLRRTRVGALTLDRALTLEAVAEAVEAGRLQASVLSMAEALGHLADATVTAAGLAKLNQGQQLDAADLEGGELPELAEGELVRLLDVEGRLAALAEPRDGRLQPRRVFHS